MNLLTNRPAETGGGVACAAAVLLVNLLHIKDPATISALVVIVGAVPAAITRAVLMWQSRKANRPASSS